jgi:hypothetical protein
MNPKDSLAVYLSSAVPTVGVLTSFEPLKTFSLDKLAPAAKFVFKK